MNTEIKTVDNAALIELSKRARGGLNYRGYEYLEPEEEAETVQKENPDLHTWLHKNNIRFYPELIAEQLIRTQYEQRLDQGNFWSRHHADLEKLDSFAEKISNGFIHLSMLYGVGVILMINWKLQSHAAFSIILTLLVVSGFIAVCGGITDLFIACQLDFNRFRFESNATDLDGCLVEFDPWLINCALVIGSYSDCTFEIIWFKDTQNSAVDTTCSQFLKVTHLVTHSEQPEIYFIPQQNKTAYLH